MISREMLEEAFTTYEADHDLACGTLLQCSNEIHVVVHAMQHGCDDELVGTALLGIARRMEVAARLASEESEAAE